MKEDTGIRLKKGTISRLRKYKLDGQTDDELVNAILDKLEGIPPKALNAPPHSEG